MRRSGRVRPAADSVFEEDVGREGDGLVCDEGEVIGRVARRLQGVDRETARLERAFDDLNAVALDELGVAGDVVGVRVRCQQVRDVQALALDDLVQRLERRAAVDEHRRPPGLVREQVRVREPVGMHAPLDQHRETVTLRERIAAR